jgi:hypothetical protein
MKNYSTEIHLDSRIEYHNEQGDRHRTDGPAVIGKILTLWYINGMRHREDGPAIEGPGIKNWYLNDIKYSEQEWEQQVAKIKLKRILDL